MPLRSTWLHFLQPPHHSCIYMFVDKIPLSLLFSRLNCPSLLSLSSDIRCSMPFIVLLDSLQHANVPLLPESPNLDLVLQRCLTGSEQRQRIPSFNLLAFLLITFYLCIPYFISLLVWMLEKTMLKTLLMLS